MQSDRQTIVQQNGVETLYQHQATLNRKLDSLASLRPEQFSSSSSLLLLLLLLSFIRLKVNKLQAEVLFVSDYYLLSSWTGGSRIAGGMPLPSC